MEQTYSKYKMLLIATYPHVLGTNDTDIPDIALIETSLSYYKLSILRDFGVTVTVERSRVGYLLGHHSCTNYFIKKKSKFKQICSICEPLSCAFQESFTHLTFILLTLEA